MSPSATPTLSTPFVPADFTTGPDFVGWYLQPTPTPMLCGPGGTYETSYTYAGCWIPTAPTPMFVTCDGTKLSWYPESESTCGVGETCSSYFIFPTEGATSDWVVRAVCTDDVGGLPEPNTLYRTLPARYLTTTSTPTITSSSSTASPTTTTTSSIPQITTGTSSSSSNSSNGLAGGAIAGIVIGCIAAIAILALLIFRKRITALFKRDRPASDDEPTLSPGHAPSRAQSMSQSGSTWQASELSSADRQIYEIGSSQAGKSPTIHELG